MTVRTALAAVVVVLLFSTSGLAAPLTITFASSLFNTAPGSSVTFSATVNNTSASAVFLNGDALNIQAPLLVDDIRFFLNAPLSLAGGQAFTAALFDVSVPKSALGLYSGNFSILGGASASSLDVVGSAPFAVNAVPEPGSAVLLLTGAMIVALKRRA